MDLRLIEINSTGGGLTRFASPRGWEDSVHVIIQHLAGPFSEALLKMLPVEDMSVEAICGEYGATDYARAARRIRTLIMGRDAYSFEKELEAARRLTLKAVRRHWDAIEDIAWALHEAGRLNRNDIE